MVIEPQALAPFKSHATEILTRLPPNVVTFAILINLCEEADWMAFVTTRLQRRWGALLAWRYGSTSFRRPPVSQSSSSRVAGWATAPLRPPALRPSLSSRYRHKRDMATTRRYSHGPAAVLSLRRTAT